MTDDRLILAIGRLERALSRIEAHGGRAPAIRYEDAPDASMAALARRHARLRDRVHGVIGRIDRLIEAEAGEG